jgi:hypothetical protein
MVWALVNHKKHINHKRVRHVFFCGLCKILKHMVVANVVHVNHKKHMVDPFVVHVYFVVRMNHKRVHHVFFVVNVKHQNTWWWQTWFM